MITRTTVAVPDPAATAAWYGDVLELTVHGTDVHVGRSVLSLVRGESLGHHHLAANIPADAAASALAWLTGRVELLIPEGGDALVEGSPDWDSESVYFRGPDGVILEVIARHRRPDRLTRPFGPGALLCLSEVGLAVADVAGTVSALSARLGLQPFGEQGSQFAPVGDEDGLLIVVPADRVWFPTAGDLPDAGPLTVEIAGAPDGHLELGVGRTVTAG